MKKILMLGGASFQVPAIKKAREMGYYVIVCDYVEESPGYEYAHEYYNISTTDKERVLSLAKSLKIDGIVCYAAESGLLTVAYVAEQLKLTSHPYKSVEILTNKDLFRTFQKENKFNVPRAEGFNSLEEAKAYFKHFNMPVMIKPVDSSGSKGVSKIASIDQLEEKVELALSFSNSKRFIIEEYIENYGPHIGGDGFSVDGKLVFRCFSNEYFSTNCINPFVPVLTTWPYSKSKHIQEKIHNEIQRVLDLLNMKTGSYNFDIRIDKNEDVYLIEITPRNGGDWNPEAIRYATGIDLLEYTIKAALGEDCSDLKMVEPTGYWATYVLNSDKSGTFKGLKIQEEFLEKNVVDYELLVKSNNTISALSGSHEKLGLMLLTFKKKQDMIKKIDNINNLIKINVNKLIISLSLPFLLLHEKMAILI
ncbi:ATP-grasp domain-containing protein [Solibacillus sp. FSL K6-1554]|uniref:ATP-grasp domain-containing protein n=1 Tax=Solibacillus sp. FSL K6-1554 TaxID=2921472 RepID=UPI0030F606D8